jgi:hypothetical protein
MSRERELPPDVFISLQYGEAGAEARALRAALRTRGIITYINDSESGVNMGKEIAEELAACHLAVVMGSETYGVKGGAINSTFKEMHMIMDEKEDEFFLIKMCDQFQEASTRLQFGPAVVSHEWMRGAAMPSDLVDKIVMRLRCICGGGSGSDASASPRIVLVEQGAGAMVGGSAGAGGAAARLNALVGGGVSGSATRTDVDKQRDLRAGACEGRRAAQQATAVIKRALRNYYGSIAYRQTRKAANTVQRAIRRKLESFQVPVYLYIFAHRRYLCHIKVHANDTIGAVKRIIDECSKGKLPQQYLLTDSCRQQLVGTLGRAGLRAPAPGDPAPEITVVPRQTRKVYAQVLGNPNSIELEGLLSKPISVLKPRIMQEIQKQQDADYLYLKNAEREAEGAKQQAEKAKQQAELAAENAERASAKVMVAKRVAEEKEAVAKGFACFGVLQDGRQEQLDETSLCSTLIEHSTVTVSITR